MGRLEEGTDLGSLADWWPRCLTLSFTNSLRLVLTLIHSKTQKVIFL